MPPTGSRLELDCPASCNSLRNLAAYSCEMTLTELHGPLLVTDVVTSGKGGGIFLSRYLAKGPVGFVALEEGESPNRRDSAQKPGGGRSHGGSADSRQAWRCRRRSTSSRWWCEVSSIKELVAQAERSPALAKAHANVCAAASRDDVGEGCSRLGLAWHSDREAKGRGDARHRRDFYRAALGGGRREGEGCAVSVSRRPSRR